VKLADFGLAKEVCYSACNLQILYIFCMIYPLLLFSDTILLQITKFNAVKSCKGTVYWMAPEVCHHILALFCLFIIYRLHIRVCLPLLVHLMFSFDNLSRLINLN
jgi:serine/threonine protein kinase